MYPVIFRVGLISERRSVSILRPCHLLLVVLLRGLNERRMKHSSSRKACEEDSTEESSDYDESVYEDLKKRKAWYEKEVDRFEGKKARHEARKRLEEIEAQKATLAEEEEKLRQVIKKSK